MFKKISLFFTFFTLISSMDLFVDPNIGTATSTTYPALDQALCALLQDPTNPNGGTLVDTDNSITLLPSCIGTVLYFPSFNVQGDGTNTLTIQYQNSAAFDVTWDGCGNLPTVVLNPSSFLQLTLFSAVTIDGIYFLTNYPGAPGSFYANVTTSTFSNICFTFDYADNPDSGGSNNNPALGQWVIESGSQFSLTKMYYLSDSLHQFAVNDTAQINIDSVSVILMSNSDLYSALFHLNNNEYDSDSNGVAYSTYAIVTATNITVSLDPYNGQAETPKIIEGSYVYSVSISGLNLINFNVQTSLMWGQIVINLDHIMTLSLDTVTVTNSGQSPYTDSNMFYFSAIPTLSFTNWNVVNGYSQGAYLILLDDSATGGDDDATYTPMVATHSGWNVTGPQTPFSMIKFSNQEYYGHISFEDFDISDTIILTNFITLLIPYSNDTDSQQIPQTKFTFSSLSVTNVVILTNNLFFANISGIEFVPSVEIILVEILDSTFNGNTVSQGNVFRIEGMQVYRTPKKSLNTTN